MPLFLLAVLIPELPAQNENMMEKRILKNAGKPSAGLSLLLIQSNKTVISLNAGFADRKKGIAISTNTHFRIGSITKQFTAAAILRLCEQGKLDLDSTVSKFFPELPHAERITVRMLLNHTSGIKPYTEAPGFLSRVKSPIQRDELVKLICTYEPEFAPGEMMKYNNSAYFLAGVIVEKVSGLTLDEFWKKEFFIPLSLAQTGVFSNAHPPTNAAIGYSPNGKKESLDWDMLWAGGAGNLYSTAHDLFFWTEALHSGKILSAPFYREMTNLVILPENSSGLDYGLGLLNTSFKGKKVIGHSGGLDGWSSDAIYFPSEKMVVIALANSSAGGKTIPPYLTRQLADLRLAKQKTNPSLTLTQDPEDFTGQYDYDGLLATVRHRNGKLEIGLTGQPFLPVTQTGSDRFIWIDADAEISFLRNQEGKVIAARHHQNGYTIFAPRIDFNAAPGDLIRFTGIYEYPNIGKMTIRLEKGVLKAKMENQPEFEISAAGKNRFRWKVIPASLEFILDKDGQVTKAIHRQGGSVFFVQKLKSP